MKAVLLRRHRQEFEDGTIIDIVLWRLPKPVPPCGHRYKYRLFYGRAGTRIVGYDNERGKGDHRHLGGREEPYRFESPERLIDDFFADVERSRK